MTGNAAPVGLRYRAPEGDGREPAALVPWPTGSDTPRFPFWSRLEIGRDDGKRPEEPGLLLVADAMVSRQHCVLTRRLDGRCRLRDLSRNGTRLDGRRLVPNVETDVRPGQTITVGESRSFVLLCEAVPSIVRAAAAGTSMETMAHADRVIATVVVGDIKDYTVLSRRDLSEETQRAVRRVFEALTALVLKLGGTVKEYQGDAIVAFWEGDDSGIQAVKALEATRQLDALACRIGADPRLWPVKDHPLEMHWALATGLVLIDSIGEGQAVGLSMMGEPIVRAFRLEKFAGPDTGRILACRATRAAAGNALPFRDVGERTAKGFDRPDRVFALAERE
jgi:class 3 adenylate cyclase